MSTGDGTGDTARTPIVVVVDGELDASDGAWSSELQAAVAAGQSRVVVDMLGVSFIDSSVVRRLVEAYRALDTGWLRVVYTHHLIRRVIAICGLADALPQYTSVEAALRGNPSLLRPSDDYGYAELGAMPGPDSTGDDAGASTDADDRHRPGPQPRQGSAPR